MAKRILVIEDDIDLLNTIEILLKDEGYEVSAYTSANGFADRFEKEKPDVVLLDVKLPGISGDEAAAEIKGHPMRESTKVVLMSAWDDIVQRARKAEADAYIRKPFNFDTLIKILA